MESEKLVPLRLHITLVASCVNCNTGILVKAEAVITWKTKINGRINNCIRTQ